MYLRHVLDDPPGFGGGDAGGEGGPLVVAGGRRGGEWHAEGRTVVPSAGGNSG